MRLMHGDEEIDARFSTYVDMRPFDSFKSVIENVYRRFVHDHKVLPTSSLVAEVVTTIQDTPLLSLDDDVTQLLGTYTRNRGLQENAKRLAEGLPHRCYGSLPSWWGRKVTNCFAHETGQLPHMLSTVEAKPVAVVVAWTSAKGLPTDADLAEIHASLQSTNAKSAD